MVERAQTGQRAGRQTGRKLIAIVKRPGCLGAISDFCIRELGATISLGRAKLHWAAACLQAASNGRPSGSSPSERSFPGSAARPRKVAATAQLNLAHLWPTGRANGRLWTPVDAAS